MSRGLSSFFARLLGLASTICSLIVIAGFVLFIVNQSKTASARQQAVLRGTGEGLQRRTAGQSAPGAPSAAAASSQAGRAEAQRTSTEPEDQGTLQQAIHGAAKALRSPFAGLTSSSHSRWLIEVVGTLLALLLYGFILRYLMRMLTVRVRT